VPTPIKVAAQISEVIQHADDLRSFIMVPTRRIPVFAPGQFLHLALDAYESGSHWPDSRVFSIASSPLARESLRVTISRQGPFTTRMFEELRVGSQVWLKLPYGSFSPNVDLAGRTVMLAGGSGVTPFISFLRWAAASHPKAAIDLHYGARTADMLIYRDEIEQCIADGMSDLRVSYYVEQSSGGALPANTQVGRLSTKAAWQALTDPASSRFYLSGPKAMIDAFRSQLVGLGATPDAVLSDDWS
jgi:ferredoxin-NADP reductase